MNPNKLPWHLSIWLILGLVGLAGCGRRNSTPANDSSTLPAPVPKTQLVPLTNMMVVKAGQFIRMGQPVTISRDYWLGKYEVTQGEYTALMGKNPSHFTNEGPNLPIEKLRWVDAMNYCDALTAQELQAGRLTADHEYRLPTEAEWEYACRAGTTNFFSFGQDSAEAEPYAWTAEISDGKPHPVGQKRPNPWGFYDMHGNVWEWCLDWFEPKYPAGEVSDPFGPSQGKFKVFRGGGWNQDIEYARVANRFMMEPSNGIHFVGFRLALGPKRPPPLLEGSRK